MYGELEGLSKPRLAKELGEERVQTWRAGLYARPPAMSREHRFWHGNERKYADLETIPATESLEVWSALFVSLLLSEGQALLSLLHSF